MAGNRNLVLPTIGSIVTCTVSSIHPRMARVEIALLRGTFKGQIRVQDVRATEIDTVKITDSFRPGDIVVARVISLGDARSYYLSTAEVELGVVSGISTDGSPLVPVSWCEMHCVDTGLCEKRKVAKRHIDDT